MEKIASFTIDHTRLLRGIYVSRRDTLPGGGEITTFDIRMTEPNRQPPIAPAALHAMEHLAATYLRNHPQWGPRVVYWGPMGCCTGNYLLLQGHLDSTDILPLVDETMRWIAAYGGEIPGATPRDCGNHSFMDPEGARRAAGTYVREVLECITPANLAYPK